MAMPFPPAGAPFTPQFPPAAGFGDPALSQGPAPFPGAPGFQAPVPAQPFPGSPAPLPGVFPPAAQGFGPQAFPAPQPFAPAQPFPPAQPYPAQAFGAPNAPMFGCGQKLDTEA
ncbi:hypothetical protein EMOOHJMP_00079 [Microcystis phage MaAM05]|nr:hypothetical protein EMOOHJMP_00079 [Microcystis phage MaAM05]